ncbi:O-methyltransferase B [Pyrenophora seminiperda CCB06]|uniref:O-methyltransferase B n=1 Tax=Pyrenophora seminiperda CCB06 TaxID=1302712 RepID=A0A3M7MDC5_9PLEO|nr:O-methyltransferase B [Pyrenophora seminiperda CCB06]
MALLFGLNLQPLGFIFIISLAEMTTDTQNGSAEVNGREKLEVKSPVDIGIAVRACNPDAVPVILGNLLVAFGKVPSVHEDDTRLAMLAHARELVRALETPRETMIQHNWAQPSCQTAITTCYNAGVFAVLTDGTKSVDEIASQLGMNREVLGPARMMKHIAAMGYIIETGADEYAPTSFSKALTIPVIGDGYPALAGGAHVSCSKFPTYMQQMKYANPATLQPRPYQYAFDTELDMFQYVHAHEPLGIQFDHHMGGYRQGRPSWMDANFYPVAKRLIKDMSTAEDAVLLVDIGGGLGHDLGEFRAKHPDAPGRLVLQDLPNVITSIQTLDPKIERMEYDFYTEQPVKGARAYYMHSVLHDWTDDVCEKILQQIVGAMKRGYSRLLINENVIPDKGADWQVTALDMMMMTLFASKERTLSEWRQLLESPKIGLKIVDVWSSKHSQESLIECELV